MTNHYYIIESLHFIVRNLAILPFLVHFHKLWYYFISLAYFIKKLWLILSKFCDLMNKLVRRLQFLIFRRVVVFLFNRIFAWGRPTNLWNSFRIWSEVYQTLIMIFMRSLFRTQSLLNLLKSLYFVWHHFEKIF